MRKFGQNDPELVKKKKKKEDAEPEMGYCPFEHKAGRWTRRRGAQAGHAGGARRQGAGRWGSGALDARALGERGAQARQAGAQGAQQARPARRGTTRRGAHARGDTAGQACDTAPCAHCMGPLRARPVCAGWAKLVALCT